MWSPFPGLDPYLQNFWRDVHASLIIYGRELLAAKLPDPLRMFAFPSLTGEEKQWAQESLRSAGKRT